MSMRGKLSCKTYDPRGNGDGEICCTITGDHQSRITDYTAILLEKKMVFDGSRRHGYEPFGEVCETIQAAYGTGGATRRLLSMMMLVI